MIKVMSDDHVLPRPVERLPDYAHAKARQNLAEKIIDRNQCSKQIRLLKPGGVLGEDTGRQHRIKGLE